TEEEHDDNFCKVLNRLREYGLQENKSKRIFKQNNIRFLGYQIEFNVLRPIFERGEGITNFIVPKNRKQLQRFLGMVNYDRMFLKGITEIARPLYTLLNKDIKVEWTPKCEEAFTKVKEYWNNELKLITPDFNKRFILESDASDCGIGAVLRQEHGPILYISRALKGSELHYSITEKELLAAIWAMEKCEHFLLGREFTLVTDHQAVCFINNKRSFGSDRIKRWFDRLQRFTFDVNYRPGNENVQADALSRSIKNCTEIDEEAFKAEVLSFHEKLNHRKNIRYELKQKGIDIKTKMLRSILEDCCKCQIHDVKVGNDCSMYKTTEPGELVAVDMLEISKKKRVVVLIDYFTRIIFTKCLRSKDVDKIVKFIDTTYKEFKFKKLLCDGGGEFNNKFLKGWAEKSGVKILFSVPYYHPLNGRVERVNRTLREAIKKTNGPLKKKLKVVTENYNNSYHRGIDTTPRLALKRENWQSILDHAEKYEKEFHNNKKSIKQERFEIGDEVILRNEIRKSKMDPRYKEKAKIVK
ncbi:MAG: RNase H-like domain-containing protein, partial [Fusobacteriaceae bacterium]